MWQLPPTALVCRQAADRFGDRREPVGEVRSASAPDWDAGTLLAGEDPETVVLDLAQLADAGGRLIDERRLARADEADAARGV